MDFLQEENIFQLKVSEESKAHLSAIAQWAKINAMIGFTSLGVTIVSLFTAIGKGGMPNNAIGATLVVSLITVAVSLFLNITLFGASKNIKTAVDSNDQGFFSIGIAKLASYFKIVGILFVIGLVCFVLFVLFMILISAFSR